MYSLSSGGFSLPSHTYAGKSFAGLEWGDVFAIRLRFTFLDCFIRLLKTVGILSPRAMESSTAKIDKLWIVQAITLKLVELRYKIMA